MYVAVIASAFVLVSSVPAVPARAATFVLLQMNLCNSGMAPQCYTFGKAVDEAVSKIRRYPPDLVTLQEVCSTDLYTPDGWGKLGQAMADLYGADNVSVDFIPAFNKITNSWYRCTNGALFGVATMHRGPSRDLHYGWYTSQDTTDEGRAWMCTTVVAGRLTGCTTHLSTDPAIAMAQCRELMSSLKSRWAMPEVIVAGDLNLLSQPGKAYDVRNCVPGGYEHVSDDVRQHVFFTRSIDWVGGRPEAMQFTDHPLLYQRFRV
jgi:endonuclease/exonuclease/phosphatase family metal-dependent hydrolase